MKMTGLHKNRFSLTLVFGLLFLTNVTNAQVTVVANSVAQTPCSNIVKVKFNANHPVDLLTLDFGVTWDPTKLMYYSHTETSLLGGMGDLFSPNTSMINIGQFGYNWGTNLLTGHLFNGSEILEITFIVLNDNLPVDIDIEDNAVSAFEATEDVTYTMLTPVVPTPLSNLSITKTSLNIEALPTFCGQSYSVSVTVGSCYTDLISTQFSLNWDPAKLQYDSYSFSTNPGGDMPPPPNLTLTAMGKFGYQWGALSPPNVLNGVDLPNGTVLFVVNFTVLSGLPTVSFGNDPLPTEVFDVFAGQIDFSGNTSNTYSFSTDTDGDYFTDATWVGDCQPPNPIPSGVTVTILNNVQSNSPITNNGSFLIGAGTFTNASTFKNTSTFTKLGNFSNIGTFTGTGTFIGDFNNTGTFSPGN